MPASEHGLTRVEVRTAFSVTACCHDAVYISDWTPQCSQLDKDGLSTCPAFRVGRCQDVQCYATNEITQASEGRCVLLLLLLSEVQQQGVVLSCSWRAHKFPVL